MKLYTEEQVREAYLEGWNDGQNDNIGYIDRVVHNLTPIELPSDEEIGFIANKIDKSSDWEDGAKWMIDKIQGGEK